MKFTTLSTTKQMSWLKVLLSGYAVIWTVSLLYCLAFYVFKCSTEIEYVLMISGASGFLFINMLVRQALIQSAVFYGLTSEETGLLEEHEADKETVLPTDHQKSRIERFMDSEKPFLNPDLSVNQLAKQMGVSPRDLSFVINHGFEKNFFDFVGDYRISHATELLDLRQAGKTILDGDA